MFLKKLFLFSNSGGRRTIFYLHAKFAEGLDGEALRADGRVRAHVGEGVLSSGGRGDGPLQQAGQQGSDQVLGLVGQLGVTRDIGDGHHDVLSYDLQQQLLLISLLQRCSD